MNRSRVFASSTNNLSSLKTRWEESRNQVEWKSRGACREGINENFRDRRYRKKEERKSVDKKEKLERGKFKVVKRERLKM